MWAWGSRDKDWCLCFLRPQLYDQHRAETEAMYIAIFALYWSTSSHGRMLQKFETRLTLIESLLDFYELKLMWRARVLDHVESSSTNQLPLYIILYNLICMGGWCKSFTWYTSRICIFTTVIYITRIFNDQQCGLGLWNNDPLFCYADFKGGYCFRL
jgi:hypothetical protein